MNAIVFFFIEKFKRDQSTKANGRIYNAKESSGSVSSWTDGSGGDASTPSSLSSPRHDATERGLTRGEQWNSG